MEQGRPRGLQRSPFGAERRLVTAGLRAGRRKAPIYGLMDIDVTRARELLERQQDRSSFTAFVASSLARAAAAHPEVHAYRDWRGRLVTHQHVDIMTIVEIQTSRGLFTLPHVLRDADIRPVPDLTAELHQVKHAPFRGDSQVWVERGARLTTRIPGATRGMYAVMARSVAARQRIGTVGLTSIGMFSGGSGFGLTPLTLMSLEVVVGGTTSRPRVVDGRVVVRDVLDLTVVVDHNVVDGGPAARFAAHLRELIESAETLSPG